MNVLSSNTGSWHKGDRYEDEYILFQLYVDPVVAGNFLCIDNKGILTYTENARDLQSIPLHPSFVFAPLDTVIEFLVAYHSDFLVANFIAVDPANLPKVELLELPPDLL